MLAPTPNSLLNDYQIGDSATEDDEEAAQINFKSTLDVDDSVVDSNNFTSFYQMFELAFNFDSCRHLLQCEIMKAPCNPLKAKRVLSPG